jgi:CheY-like chemotaxis protein
MKDGPTLWALHMAVIATLLPQAQLQRLRLAIRDRHEVAACDDWETLARTCERQPVRVAVIDLFMDGEANFENVRQLKQRLPRLSLICYIALSLERARDLFDAGRQGMDGLVVMDRDDAPIEFLKVIGVAESRTLADVIRKQVSGTDPVVYDSVMLAITRAHERLSPTRLAKLLNVPRRTLSQRLMSGGYPPPLRLLTWGRLHSTPGQIRTRGGAQFVIRAFFRQVHTSRKTTTVTRSARRLALAV